MKVMCPHKWEEDEMFASGVIMMMVGTVGDIGEETRVNCTLCGAVDYLPKNIFNRIDLTQ